MDPLNTPALMMSAVLVVHLIGAAVIATSAAIVFTTVAIVVSIVKGCRQDLMPRRKVGEPQRKRTGSHPPTPTRH